ncbi:serine/threonine-protein kinase pim-3-like [Ctenopharyngodon idella]|uniref:serine/threonine-protein kinase pim-3-like n=1 Tax=Ctenopharyngodon idella TaxID=7959 RepID=UPI00222F2A5F|nr:serine/threonine-protein kinase pim-3-like [Ctenopharyngodon idella]
MMIRVSEGPSVPQIIKLLDWYETRNHYILVIERPTPCKDLRQYLVQNGGRISESKARVVMHQVVTAARICFEKGIYRSDIKLENLLINENSLQVKLIDFGVGRSFKTFGYTRYIGTKLYAPPEAFRRTWRYHAKPATVYSLGVLLFVMLFGKYPYKVKPEVIADILRKAGISKESKELISSCMETDPTKRIDLDKILDHDWFQVLLLKPESQNEEPILPASVLEDIFIDVVLQEGDKAPCLTLALVCTCFRDLVTQEAFRRRAHILWLDTFHVIPSVSSSSVSVIVSRLLHACLLPRSLGKIKTSIRSSIIFSHELNLLPLTCTLPMFSEEYILQ